MKLKFNQRVIQWLASFWGNLSLAILVSVLASILLNFENFKQSEIWDFLIEMEPMYTPVVLSPKLQHDVDGKFSSWIRFALNDLA